MILLHSVKQASSADLAN